MEVGIDEMYALKLGLKPRVGIIFNDSDMQTHNCACPVVYS